METFYRIQERGRDPLALLDPESWVSRIWTGYAERECSTCRTTGRVRCSCADVDECESSGCDGSQSCDDCRGAGYVEDTERRGGVSCCRTYEELMTYFGRRDAALEDTVLVVLEGAESDIEDFDAEEGAVLVRPARIVKVRDFDPQEVQQ
jgi:hypothetical protein